MSRSEMGLFLSTFLRHAATLIVAGVGAWTGSAAFAADGFERPNIIFLMADDLGWGDVGYNGNTVIKTPRLDRMSREGLRFDRFYANSPVCSPTRGGCLTGRHPYRYGITFANVGHMPKEEVTIAEALKAQGYSTGHFGKWHLGTLSKTVKDGNRGGEDSGGAYSPPWDNGLDVCFSTESKVPTWNPTKKPGTDEPYGTHYWTGPDQLVKENLDGDDSRVIMDRVVPFIRKAAQRRTPFLAVVWFHTPHKPCVAGGKYLEMYQGDKSAHYYGAITAMDEQIGRLREELKDAGVAGNTMLWFSSDNGPEKGTPRSAGRFRDRKRSLYEGGVRVPGLLVWPDRITQPRTTDLPCSTLDYFPTVLDVLGVEMEEQPMPLDGESLKPLIDGTMKERPRPIGFESGDQIALSDNRYKLIKIGKGDYELYDLTTDKSETTDIAAQHPDVVKKMREQLQAWRASCKRSNAGDDYRGRSNNSD